MRNFYKANYKFTLGHGVAVGSALYPWIWEYGMTCSYKNYRHFKKQPLETCDKRVWGAGLFLMVKNIWYSLLFNSFHKWRIIHTSGILALWTGIQCTTTTLSPGIPVRNPFCASVAPTGSGSFRREPRWHTHIRKYFSHFHPTIDVFVYWKSSIVISSCFREYTRLPVQSRVSRSCWYRQESLILLFLQAYHALHMQCQIAHKLHWRSYFCASCWNLYQSSSLWLVLWVHTSSKAAWPVRGRTTHQCVLYRRLFLYCLQRLRR